MESLYYEKRILRVRGNSARRGTGSGISRGRGRPKKKEYCSSSSIRLRSQDAVKKNIDYFPKRKKHKVHNASNNVEQESYSLNLTTLIKRCVKCQQLINENLILYNGHPENAVIEKVGLSHQSLSLFTGEERNIKDVDRLPRVRITGFSVYDCKGHLVPFDNVPNERLEFIFMSGYLRPLCDENSEIDGAVVAVKDVGGITSWTITGFEGGDKFFIILSTALGEYYLADPSESYKSYMSVVNIKCHLVKIVFEYLRCNPESEYEELINTLQSTVLPYDANLTEETLLQHSQFLCSQIESLDENRDTDEPHLMSSRCMVNICKLSGRKENKSTIKIKHKKLPQTKATTTPLVNKIFESLFPNHLNQNNMNSSYSNSHLNTGNAKLGGKNCDAHRSHSSVMWASEPLNIEGPRTYYSAVCLEDKHRTKIEVGDYVLVDSKYSNDKYVFRVNAFWENSNREKLYHSNWFCNGKDTILGDTSDPNELFLMDYCGDSLVHTIHSKVNVVEFHSSSNWFDVKPFLPEYCESFFYQKWYCPETARFQDIPEDIKDDVTPNYRCCQCCLRKKAETQFKSVTFGPVFESGKITAAYKSVSFRGCQYKIGDCIFLESEAINFSELEDKGNALNMKESHDVNEDIYPEYYRKSSRGRSNKDTTDPFIIVRILRIFSTVQENIADPKEVKIHVAIFYRPEETHRGKYACDLADFNYLYWTEEESTVKFTHVNGKCWVVCKENLLESVDDFTKGGPSRFYFDKAYDVTEEKFFELPSSALAYGANGEIETYPKVSRKLRSLDVFAGCGGLSEGLREAEIADCRWAIEMFEPAAEAFSQNHKSATVFVEDCNQFLADVIEGKRKNDKGQILPQKGDVELLCGGPPCQGFSRMNRFKSTQYSQFKNSLVSSYLSYCDYYRPKYFLLENVRNFISFNDSMVLKLTLRVLVKMGYQCCVGILQAGNFMIPQTRKRAFIFAAAPGEKLPNYPNPLTSFTASQCATVDNKQYYTNCLWLSSAPYRTVTVRDSLSDLPKIQNGANKIAIEYGLGPQTHIQRLLRPKKSESLLLRDHICKLVNPLALARMEHIPTDPGSDWRDLPNIKVKLTNKETTKLLYYMYDDKKKGRSSTGALRGLCRCVKKDQDCDPGDKLDNTLIPWFVAHTANSNNNWAGLYGRIAWNGFFSTTVTNPEPLGMQGRVLHPDQHRIVSVRECARSQGFPDQYRFSGNLLDKHRQIGNAVPPPLAKAIGFEIRKSVHLTEQKKSSSPVEQ